MIESCEGGGYFVWKPDDQSEWIGSFRLLYGKLTSVRIADERLRNRGFGKLMMAEVCAFANAHGCTRIRLRVMKDNHRAIRFYESVGFKVHSIGSDDIALTMYKDL
jgi:ribosomal protein S18 acetylase RimI-like enzyme